MWISQQALRPSVSARGLKKLEVLSGRKPLLPAVCRVHLSLRGKFLAPRTLSTLKLNTDSAVRSSPGQVCHSSTVNATLFDASFVKLREEDGRTDRHRRAGI